MFRPLGRGPHWHLHPEERSMVVVRISCEPVAGGGVLLSVGTGSLGP